MGDKMCFDAPDMLHDRGLKNTVNYYDLFPICALLFARLKVRRGRFYRQTSRPNSVESAAKGTSQLRFTSPDGYFVRAIAGRRTK